MKNPQYNIYKELLNYYYYYSNSGDEQTHSLRLLKRLVNNLVSLNGWEIASFFNERIATTKPEIKATTHINWQSVNIIVNLFVETGFLKVLGQVGSPYRTTGRPIPIYGFCHASPEHVAEAQRRYGDIRSIKLGPKDTPEKIIEAVALAKAYMDKRGLITVPDRKVIVPILKEKGIKINYNSIIQALVKEGYHL